LECVCAAAGAHGGRGGRLAMMGGAGARARMAAKAPVLLRVFVIL